MTQPRQHLWHRCHDLPRRQGWSVDHNDRKAQGTGGQYFGRSAGAACVFGDDVGDAVGLQQGRIMRHIKGAARDDCGGVRQGQRGRWIYQPQQVMVLGFGGKGREGLLADGEEHPPGRIGQGDDGGRNIGNMGPVITCLSLPRRAFQGEELHAAGKAGRNGISAHLCCKGVGGVDDMGDVVGLHIFTQARHAAKAADAGRQGLGHRVGRAPGIGKHGVDADGREGGGEVAGFGRAAQEEGAHG